MLAGGDLVELYLDHLPLIPWRISAQDVIFQDKYLIVVNKPAMIETQPTHARYKGTLFEALQVYLQDSFRPHLKPVIGMVQRLDRSTSGLIAFSIHPQAHKKMTELFKTGSVDKTYLALVSGRPGAANGEIRSLLARSRRGNRVHTVPAGGKLAITRYRIESQLNSSSMLEVQILTGRSHQIRAHMSELGCPLLGDQRYGGPMTLDGILLNRPLLHAHRLKFLHPLTAQPLDFSVPMPADMHQALQLLKEVTR
jgi:23S rRNA pseudouridine1911/1915/1917 synthase